MISHDPVLDDSLVTQQDQVPSALWSSFTSGIITAIRCKVQAHTIAAKETAQTLPRSEIGRLAVRSDKPYQSLCATEARNRGRPAAELSHRIPMQPSAGPLIGSRQYDPVIRVIFPFF